VIIYDEKAKLSVKGGHMAKRIKKPAVRPELAREWLRRYEEDGESPPQIAQADGYDVRTVRKQLERMSRERELREAKHVVLRQALEKHYVDICSFAEKLRAEISGLTPSTVSPILKDDPMWKALRQHLPRSPLWRDIDRVERLAEPFMICLDNIKERVRNEAESRTSLQFVSSGDEIGFTDGLSESIAFHLQSIARGERGLAEVSYSKKSAKTLVRIEHGAFSIALVPEVNVEEVIAISRGLEKDSTEWQECQELFRLTQEFLKVQQGLKEELTRVILRRVVPGKCMYCPF
jgi:hypothetical protein